MTFQARNINLNHRIDSDTLKIISSCFSFEVYSEELEEKNWDNIEVSYCLGDKLVQIQHVEYYAGAPEEYMNLSDLSKELKEDGISYEDIVDFVKSKISQLTTTHLSRCF